MSMNIDGVVKLAQPKHLAFVVGALFAAGAVGGWGISTTLATNVTAIESEMSRNSDIPKLSKSNLVGSYGVTGTDADGTPYSGSSTRDISLAPSGALELAWDNGRVVGVGQLVDNVLAVAYSIKGRTVISLMTINADGSLSGKWLRRTDRGSKGTETWTRG